MSQLKKETFKTPNGKPLTISRNELIKTSQSSIKLWQSIEKEKGWKIQAKKELTFWRFMLKQATIQKEKTSLKAPASKGLTTLCAMNVGVTGRRKKDGTQKKGYVAKKGGKLVKKSTKTRKVKL
ncbi:hypothetical protein [Flavobacterium sp. GCM10023249]|uniref:hypothetical protein n=1 Tax=unclassified Flavobacterium TaxID=196869 RepID=UPI0036093136